MSKQKDDIEVSKFIMPSEHLHGPNRLFEGNQPIFIFQIFQILSLMDFISKQSAKSQRKIMSTG